MTTASSWVEVAGSGRSTGAGGVTGRAAAGRAPPAAGCRGRRGPALDGAERPVVGPVQRCPAVEAGRDDGDPHLVAERVVDDRAEDDVGLGVRGLLRPAGPPR